MTTAETLAPCVNGVPLCAPGDAIAVDALRQRACTELLRQAAQRGGLLAADDAPTADGVISDAASAAIDALIAREVVVPEPTDEALRRHFAAHEAQYRTGERVRVRHILFAQVVGERCAVRGLERGQRLAGRGRRRPARVDGK